MIDLPARVPLAVVHCGWPRDRELVGELLASVGAEMWPMGDPADLRTLIDDDRIDLVVADSTAGVDAIAHLIGILDGDANNGGLPMVFLADPAEIAPLSDLVVRRLNAVLLTKPTGREQLVAAVESGLRYRARQREVGRLLAELEDANERLASANAALEVRREEAAEEARRKSRFLAAISHDIRTPVNALVLSCQLLRMVGQGNPGPGEIRELTGGLLDNASALAELVNDLLDIARYDQGKLEFIESDFPLGDFLAGTLGGMKPLATQKGLALRSEVKTPRALLRTDRVKLARVVQNLVANAIKFTDSGSIDVVATADPAGGLSLEVRDTGVGIPESMRESIFDEFAQLRNPERDRTKGTGLGLAICRRLVNAMGGAIRVATEPGQRGSTFLVTLPAERVFADARAPGETAEAGRRGPLGQFTGRVLLVEDHEPSRLLLRRLLEQSGLEVEAASNGREAIHALDRVRPELVLMDLMMPEMGGREALRIIRSRKDFDGLPVVILTGDLGDRGDSDLILAGASACLSKPVEFTKLAALLQDLVPAALTDQARA